jgi:hypothetical protein
VTFADKLTEAIDLINREAADLIVVAPCKAPDADTGELPIRDHRYWDAHCDAAHALVTLREMARERGRGEA